MILSMTGFGSAERHERGVSYRAEIRSVNNRYFKASIKLPDMVACFEAVIEQRLRNRLGRGSVTFSLSIKDESPQAACDVNMAALQSYVERLAKLRVDGATIQIDAAALMELPGVCQPRELTPDAMAAHQSLIEQLTDAAVDRLIEMRRQEGAALRRDMLEQCEKIRQLLGSIRERCPAVVDEYHKKLRTRVNMLLAQSQLELAQDDLVREVAIFADRCDVNEECARLDSHLEQFARLSDQPQEAGRKLDFLSQEMLREANTIGSKSNDTQIARLIVDIKALIDRIKEQVQNVE